MLGKMFGPELVNAFGEFKQLWDPEWKMNPGKVVHPFRIDENRRLTHEDQRWNPKTHFQFPDDEYNFRRATLRCVGVGKCRRTIGQEPGDDVMCPSFLVTHEEKHTTRGRTHLLFELLKGEELEPRWHDDHVKEALDLCLARKGCKGDCPVNVDVATYKAEFLSHYWEGRLRPRHAYAFGWIDKWVRLASIWPGAVNLVTQTPGLAYVAKVAAGVAPQRDVPQFAPSTFGAFLEKHTAELDLPRLTRKTLVQAHCHHKAIMKTKQDEALLTKMGADYELLNAGCCGMAGSFGFESDKYDVSLAIAEYGL